MRGLMIFSGLMLVIGLPFLLLGLGVDIGKWWPAVFCIIGLVSLMRGISERAHVVFGMMMLGWGAAGVIALHSFDLGIANGWLFFIGLFFIWMPLSWLIGKAVTPTEKWEEER